MHFPRRPLRGHFFLLVAAVTLEAATPLYKIDTFAGTGYTGDGRPSAQAIFVQPQCVALDRAGNIYISDTADHRVRRIGYDGIVRTIAGTGQPGIRGDGGPATQAQLNAPYGIAVDAAGNVFIADLGNAVVRRVSPDGMIQTYAGGGKVRLNQPRDVAIDRAGNLLIADFGAHRIYSVTPAGTISVAAGTGQPDVLAYPSALAVDLDGSVLIADSGNRRVRRLAAGVLTTLLDRNNREIEFGTPIGITVDGGGRIYVADGSPTRIAVVLPNGELVSSPIGGTSVAVTPYFEVLTVLDRRVRRLTGGRIETIAGQGSDSTTNPAEWRFSFPSGAVRDSAGNLWIADTALGRIRRINARNELTTITAELQAPISLAADSAGRIYAGDRSGNGGVYRVDTGQPKPVIEGQGRTLVPTAIAFDTSNYLYIADAQNNVVRRVSPEDGSSIVLAGGGVNSGDGIGVNLKLAAPAGIAVDASGTVWFSEAGTGRIRRISSGRVTTVPDLTLQEPRGLHFDKAGNLWIAETGAHRIIVLKPNGTSHPVAGSRDKGFSGDGGLALAATLNTPTDVLPEADGSAIIVDAGNDRLRRIELTKADPDPAPEPVTLSPLSLLHAATLTESDVAPGQLAYITGTNLTSPEATLANQRLAIWDATSTRLTVQIPPSTPTGFAELVVTSAGQIYGKTAVKVVPTAPGILAAVNPLDNQPNSPEHPAERAAPITFYVTGDGINPTPVITAEIGGYPADVLWTGPAPGLVGIRQINLQTPGGFAPSGVVSTSLTIDGARTQRGFTIVSR